MDPMQIPVPTTPVAPQMQPEVPQVPVQSIPQVAQAVPAQAPVVPQEDFIDKLLKGIVNFVANIINKNNQPGPTVPLGVVPQAPIAGQTVPTAPVMSEAIPTPMPQAPTNIFNTIGSGIENAANQAVNVAQTGVNSVVQGAQNYIAEPAPAQPAVDVQNFLSQNYQAAVVTAPQIPVASTIPTQAAVMPVETPAPVAVSPISTPQVPTSPIQ